jgi:probable F420-dependent oxidoreductase
VPPRWGLTLPFPGISLPDHEPLVRLAEERGYDDLWSGEATGAVDGFTPLVLAAAWTDRLRLGTGVVNPYTRAITVLAQHAAALQDASGGRFVLGLGSSSDVIVERWNGIPFVKPLSRVREAVQTLRGVLAGERGPGGFRLDPAPAPAPPIVIAALRDRMLRLGGELGDGTFVNFLPLSATPHVVEQIGAETEVVCRFFNVPQAAEEAMGLAKFMFAAYATVPVYTEFFRALGWGERLDPMVEAWRSGDRARALELAPEELIREIFVFGSPAEQHERLAEFGEAGITTFVLTPIAPPEQVPEVIRALAPAE